ncbi:MAG: hypothetical protein A2Y62_10380 [Candidatus Fischerbacteria bacterium RBG_13_37_8]|uniref:Uncharacterized protein n=1 Tax=Candidatus Fischerbacteria bacterium RBG_13_37_8 TaxID=1817863 RepID=A0A1F5VQY7_9BACT|nr:MAG: hypothetical protein A2Y62_10380 [Candidatus Fischerbacteria bacterium RBG_13_37_8]
MQSKRSGHLDRKIDLSGKDKAMQLRAVHFVLLALSLGLIVVLASEAPQDLRNAIQQLRDIDTWHSQHGDLQSFADTQIKNKLNESGQLRLLNMNPILFPGSNILRLRCIEPRKPKQPKEILIHVKYRPPNWFFSDSKDINSIEQTDESDFSEKMKPDPYQIPKFNQPGFQWWSAFSLKNFISLWNGYNDIFDIEIAIQLEPMAFSETYVQSIEKLFQSPQILYSIESESMAFEETFQYRTRDILNAKTRVLWAIESVENDKITSFDFVTEAKLFKLRPEQKTKLNPQITWAYIAYDLRPKELPLKDDLLGGFTVFYLPVRTEEIYSAIDGQKVLMGERFLNKWRRGSFQHSFPELSKIASNFQDLSIRQLESMLDDRIERSGEPLSVFGIRLPPEETTRWGIFILVAVQLYFYIHLVAFERHIKDKHDDPSWEVAWIGLYSLTASRVLSFISACLIPFVVASFSGVYLMRSEKWEWSMIAAVSVLGSFLCSTLTCKSWLGIWGYSFLPYKSLSTGVAKKIKSKNIPILILIGIGVLGLEIVLFLCGAILRAGVLSTELNAYFAVLLIAVMPLLFSIACISAFILGRFLSFLTNKYKAAFCALISVAIVAITTSTQIWTLTGYNTSVLFPGQYVAGSIAVVLASLLGVYSNRRADGQ